ncbi:MAG: rubrerythrin [Chloroflexi bacterium]|nr:rubrerythrin [Chloroflexota bacterium]
MREEVKDLLEAAMYKEVAAQATYAAAQKETDDPGARRLLKELAEDEGRHLQILKDIKESGMEVLQWDNGKLRNLMISEYLTGPDTLHNAGIQDVLLFAMKREQEAVEFYSRMMSALKTRQAKRLCEGLVHSELKHKLKLELMYDDLFYGED